MSPFESYIAPARARTGFWRVVVGILLILFCWVASMLVMLTAFVISKLATNNSLEAAMAQLDSLMNSHDPTAVLVMLLSFAGIWVGVFAALTWLHGQRFSTIFAPPGRHRIIDFLKGAAIMPVSILLLIAISGGAGMGMGDPQPLMPLETWLIWVGPILVLVFFQATAEELIFRGYFVQQLAVRSRYALVWAVIPSVLFGMLHYGDRPDGSDIYYIGVTAVMGLIFCTLVWRSGSLWPAIGLHVVTNAYALTIVTVDGSLVGTQLWVFQKADFVSALQMQLGILVVILIALLSPLGRIYDAPARPGGG